MLDNETRRRIDTARDILVGKVPDPKSQVEQITIALIYKFMDDMDAEAEELGGGRAFFAGDFARYGWAKLMRAGLGGNEILNRYAEAIDRMTENTGIPPLFRDIFKNAYLPYRDPETLKSFLKVIDDFTYDHSERLGDAFEYLLSVLGSQGDAGQFRTPRHVIDFIVQVVDPAKGDSILDPACGTAGFLISAYKHIRAANAQDGRPGAALTPEGRKRLVENMRGYDISPDMVRLSLVNLYLHGFADPHIYEYDTLTSEERWGEHYDVILANPPFMSPKGGIKPHKRFSVSSSRSEVLFVDYIAEHLTPGGRAGVIVPEGVIFQSQTAYKALRKLLVESALVAVVSLPAGVFNPYSGVKTSILILDRSLAKRADTVGFFKVENDGFGLGAQRRPIDKNDLPGALDELREYLRRLAAAESLEDYRPTLGLIVPKTKIAANGEYNLSGERYKESARTSHNRWPLHRLVDLCHDILSGGTPSTQIESFWNGTIPWMTSADIVNNRTIQVRKYITQDAIDNSATNLIPRGNIIVVTRVGLGKLVLNDIDVCISQDSQGLIVDVDKVIPKYLLYVLGQQVQHFKTSSQGTTIQGVTKSTLQELEIPLPPLAVQQEIVAEIEGYQRVIDGARQVVDNYRPRIAVDPDWPVVELGSLLTFVGSGETPRGGKESYEAAGVLFIRSQNILSGRHDFSDAVYISKETHQRMSRSQVEYGDVFLNITGASIGRSTWMDLRTAANVNQHVAILRSGPNLDRIFLSVFLNSDNGQQQIQVMQAGASREALNYAQIRQLKIPLPPLATQQAIVAEIEAERAVVEANRDLIARFERKIAAALARVWGER